MRLLNANIPSCFLPADWPSRPTDALEPLCRCHLRVVAGTIAEVIPAQSTSKTQRLSADDASCDLQGDIVFPGLLDAHTHLDKAHTWHRSPNRSGTFWEAIDVLAADKPFWTETDVYQRADFALRCAYAYGTVAVRTHLDTWIDDASSARPSYLAMQRLQADWRGKIELQWVSLCGLEQYEGPAGEALADLALQHGATCLGAMPQMNPQLSSQLDRLLQLAEERGMGLDLHVDENGNPEAECLRAVAHAVVRNEFTQPVTCGHCCSLAKQAPARQKETLEVVRAAGIHIISLPLCNLYLQDRNRDPFSLQRISPPRTPAWRGITLLHELHQAGITVACASDNVRDAFYAYGDLDAWEVYIASLRIGHLDSNLAHSPTVVTSAPARIMHLPTYGRISPGSNGQLIRFEARSFSELLSRPQLKRQYLSEQGWESRTPPAYTELTENVAARAPDPTELSRK